MTQVRRGEELLTPSTARLWISKLLTLFGINSVAFFIFGIVAIGGGNYSVTLTDGTQSVCSLSQC